MRVSGAAWAARRYFGMRRRRSSGRRGERSKRSGERQTRAYPPATSSIRQARRSSAPGRCDRPLILCRVRIVSLVPSATELLFALGVGDEVTAVTHECDHPAAALELPKVTRDVIGPGLPPDEIDRAVRWRSGTNVGKLAGRTVRLRFVMKDADLFALRFAGAGP